MKFQYSWPIYSLSTPWDRNWAYFRSMSSGFRDTDPFSKMTIFGHETWPLAKVAHIPSFYPGGGGRIWAYFSSMGSGFRHLDRFSYLPYNFHIIAIFEHETWPLAKVPEVVHTVYSLFTPNWAYFHSTGSGFWDTGLFSNLPYLGTKLGHYNGQSARNCTYSV